MHRIGFAIAAIFAWMASSQAIAQVVQLPTFNFFGISTTVSVPDSGAGFVGGNSIASMGRFERGVPLFGHAPVASRLLGNRALGGRAQTSSVSMSATIHDFDAIDDALLGGALKGAGRPTPLSQPRHLAGGAEPAGLPPPRAFADVAGRMSVAQLRQQQASRQRAAADEARSDFQRGRALIAEGKAGAARVYLQRAIKRADPKLGVEIDAMLRSLNLSEAVAGTDTRRPAPH